MSKEDDDNLDHLEFDGLSPLEQDAANMHEMFVALQGAGFTERQALQLVAFLIDRSDESNDLNIYINDELMKKINEASQEDEEEE
jgi:hypothetical protein